MKGRRAVAGAAAAVVVLALLARVAPHALRPAPPSTQLSVSGRIEGYERDLAAKAGGRIVWVAAREGETVRAGQILVRLDHLAVRAPSDGIVIARAVEPGDVVAPGRMLLSVVDLGRLYLRAYVPEGDVGRVRVGQRAHVSLDSDRAHPLEARVGEVDARASFTPENVYYEKGSVNEVFGVKVALLAGGRAKPGMLADATIDVGR
jgi:HlyD family secretion protein